MACVYSRFKILIHFLVKLDLRFLIYLVRMPQAQVIGMEPKSLADISSRRYFTIMNLIPGLEITDSILDIPLLLSFNCITLTKRT